MSESYYYFTFLRHAESLGNAEKRFQGWADYPLTERGLAQAHALAERWKRENRHFDVCISSPLLRARQTAEVLAEPLRLRIELDPDWRELNNGHLAGLSAEEVQDRFPIPQNLTPYIHYGEKGESRWQLFLRAGGAIQRLIDRGPGHYLIVAHGGILNMTLYAILNIPPQFAHSGPRFRFANTGFAEFTYDPARHRWELQRFDPGVLE